MKRFQQILHEEKGIGDIHHVLANFGLNFFDIMPPQARFFDPKLAGGAQLDVGPYSLLWVGMSFSHIALPLMSYAGHARAVRAPTKWS